METKTESTLVPEQQAMTVNIETVQKNMFILSQDALRDFYLKEAVLLSPSHCSPNRTEYELLMILKKEYEKISSFLNQLISFPWELCIPNLHEVCVPYLLESDVSVKNRKVVSDQISAHIRFLTTIVGNRHIAKQLSKHYNQHLNNLMRLLKQHPEHKKTGNRTA